MYFAEVYFAEVYFAEVYFAEVYFTEVYFAEVNFADVYFCEMYLTSVTSKLCEFILICTSLLQFIVFLVFSEPLSIVWAF